LADQYIDEIIQWIDEGITSLDICKTIGLCESTAGPQSVPCDICQEVVERVIQLLLEGKVEQEIINSLNELCDTYAGPYATVCKTFIDSTIDKIIKACEQGLNANEVCAKIGLCDPSGAGTKVK
jgi:saposin